MKALMKWESGAGHVALRETERPVPGPDEVLIRVAAAGICGTDIKIWHGTTWSNPPVSRATAWSARPRRWSAGSALIAAAVGS